MHAALVHVKINDLQSIDIVIIGSPIVGNDSDLEEDINEDQITDNLPEEVSSELIFMQGDKDSGNNVVIENFNESDEEVTGKANAVMENEEISSTSAQQLAQMHKSKESDEKTDFTIRKWKLEQKRPNLRKQKLSNLTKQQEQRRKKQKRHL